MTQGNHSSTRRLVRAGAWLAVPVALALAAGWTGAAAQIGDWSALTSPGQASTCTYNSFKGQSSVSTSASQTLTVVDYWDFTTCQFLTLAQSWAFGSSHNNGQTGPANGSVWARNMDPSVQTESASTVASSNIKKHHCQLIRFGSLCP